MLTLREMYNNPSEKLIKISPELIQLNKVFEYLEEKDDGSLSDLLMDSTLEKFYNKLQSFRIVNNYVRPPLKFKGDELELLRKHFEKAKRESTEIIPRRSHWLGMSEGYLYDLYAENLIENNGYNSFIVNDEFEFNLINSYFNTSFIAVKKHIKTSHLTYPFVVDFNQRIALHPMQSDFPIGTELPHVFPVLSFPKL